MEFTQIFIFYIHSRIVIIILIDEKLAIELHLMITIWKFMLLLFINNLKTIIWFKFK